MDKYSDWQKYVKEQAEKLNRVRASAPEPGARKQVPTIDTNRFVIHKKEVMPSAPEKPAEPAHGPSQNSRPSAPPFPTVEPRKPFASASQPSSKADDQPANPIASPFVSVHDVWKAAEKTSRPRAPKETDSPRIKIRTGKAPDITRTAPKTISTNESPHDLKNQTREEILDRLINPTISLEEAAKIMGVCKATVRRYTSMGILPHYRTPGNQRRFKLNDIIQFLENQKQ